MSASWLANLGGGAYSRAKTIAAPAAPTVTLAGNAKVKVNWTAASYNEGGAIATYTVRRYPAAGGAGTIRAGCNGTISALTCTENNVPTGAWVYAVTAVASKWTGTESARSATVLVP
ncbi:MAG TPA: hypothetical protein VGQ15_14340 [Gaiellaceae bacterium]|nr:hypothetical protein [Gaiellaceae bacterium]